MDAYRKGLKGKQAAWAMGIKEIPWPLVIEFYGFTRDNHERFD
jgi:hypothetical protein